MKRINIYLTILFALLALALSSCASQSNLIGSWAYNVEQTMPAYSEGTLVFEEADGDDLTGKLILQSGREIPLQSVSVEEDTVTFSASVEGSLVTTVCTIEEGNKLTGSVRTPNGDLPFLAQKQE